jgi:hypothetical protein
MVVDIDSSDIDIDDGIKIKHAASNIFIIWVMLTSAPGALVKELKKVKFTLKITLFKL